MKKLILKCVLFSMSLFFGVSSFADESRSTMETQYKESCIGKPETGLIQKFGFPQEKHEVGDTKFLMFKWFNQNATNYCSAMFTTVAGKITNVNVAEFKNPFMSQGTCAVAVINWYGTRTSLKCD